MTVDMSKTLKVTVFTLGVALLYVSVFRPFDAQVDQNALVIFGLVLLVALFEELQEFNFFGVRGKKKIKEDLEKLEETINQTEQATNPTPQQQDDLTRLRNKDIQLMGVDQGNFLALVFDIERLLRIVGALFYPDKINDNTPPKTVGKLLRENNYLTDNGLARLNAILNVRNYIVHGKLSAEDHSQLTFWVEQAYSLYAEIAADIQAREAQATQTPAVPSGSS